MHVILGFTKKLVERIKALFAKLKALKGTITKVQTGFYFRQGIEEAVDCSIQYELFLKEKFKGVILYVEGKKKQIDKHTKSIAKAVGKFSHLSRGQQQEN